MFALFLLAAALVLYGTLYPFSIDPAAHAGDILPRFLNSFHNHLSRGDVLSNVVLFMPFGFFGMQGLLPKVHRVARFILVVFLGGAFSLFIECAQTFIVGRDTSIYDLVLNTSGTFVGACFGFVDWQRRMSAGIAGHRPPTLFPLVLFGAWLAFRLFPYVPTIDFQHVKDAIKPVLTGDFTVVDVFRHFVVCLVVARVLQSILPAGKAVLAFPVLVLGVIAAKPFLMTRVMSLAEIFGALAAIAVWWALLKEVKFRTGVIASLLAIQIAVQGLLPYELLAQPASFSFIPFKGFEGGSMALNLQSFLEKVFLYGSLVWLLAEAKWKLAFAVVASAGLLLAIELAQTQLVGRVSEITDPLLSVIMGVVLYVFDRHSSRTSDAR